MTTLEHIKSLARTAGTMKDEVLSEKMLEEVMPSVIEGINKQCKDIGYDGVTYNRPASEYPTFFYKALYVGAIRQSILDYLEKNHPLAWFKPMYFTPSEFEEFKKESVKN